MWRERARRVVIYAAVIALLAATVHRFRWLGGPYFEIPDTIQDHVWPDRFLSADAIVLSRRAEPLLPRDVRVTVIAPSQAPNYDQTHWLTGLGMLPRQNVVAPKFDDAAAMPDYVIAIRGSFEHPAYRLVTQFPEGALYGRQR